MEEKTLRTEKTTKDMKQSSMTSEIKISFTLFKTHSAAKSKSKKKNSSKSSEDRKASLQEDFMMSCSENNICYMLSID